MRDRNPSKTHAVETIDNPDGIVPDDRQQITYTSFNKVSGITEGNYRLNYTYGPDLQRKYSYYTDLEVGSTPVERYYFGNYERQIIGNSVQHIHYISGLNGIVAMVVQTGNLPLLYTMSSVNYIYTDNIGSIVKVTDYKGIVIAQQNFDAWGRKRNPANWTDYSTIPSVPSWLYRGYTGHEQLPDPFNLINMNGSMYDPLLGRMLSPDITVQDPNNTQSYNKYSYVLNNPLKYTDPTGYVLTGDDQLSYTNGIYNYDPSNGNVTYDYSHGVGLQITNVINTIFNNNTILGASWNVEKNDISYFTGDPVSQDDLKTLAQGYINNLGMNFTWSHTDNIYYNPVQKQVVDANGNVERVDAVTMPLTGGDGNMDYLGTSTKTTFYPSALSTDIFLFLTVLHEAQQMYNYDQGNYALWYGQAEVDATYGSPRTYAFSMMEISAYNYQLSWLLQAYDSNVKPFQVGSPGISIGENSYDNSNSSAMWTTFMSVFQNQRQPFNDYINTMH